MSPQMSASSLVRGCRLAVPLGAFLALATLATVLAAQALIACTRQVSLGIPMAAMPGMDMSSMPMTGGAISLCPVVLVLSIAAVALTLNALAVLLFDRGRIALARYAARQPFGRTCGCIVTLGAGAVGTMMAIDGNVPQGLGGWLSLGAIVVGAAVAATTIAIGFGRCVIAFTRRIAIAFERALRIAPRTVDAGLRAQRLASLSLNLNSVCLLASGRGLRAPPSFAR
jgi:hypothetical protein